MPVLIVVDQAGVRKTLDSLTGVPLMHTLRQHQTVVAICGGMQACGTCHVFIDEPWSSRLGPRQADETELLRSLQHFDPTRSRLSCQIPNSEALDGLTLSVAPEE